MEELSSVRLYLLRAMYLLIAVGMGLQIWPLILHHPSNVEHMRGVTRSAMLRRWSPTIIALAPAIVAEGKAP